MASINTSLRLPEDVYDRLKRQAERQDRTMHNLVLHYVQRGLREDERRAAEEEQS